MSPPYATPRIAVAVLSAAMVVASLALMRRFWVESPSLPALLPTLVEQFLTDLRTHTRSLQWLAVLGWGALVVSLHAALLANDLYVQLPWLDLPSHAMSGAGVAAVLLVGVRRELPARSTAWWLVLSVLAVGAGFELYEFLLKGFWHDWTLGVYVTDTLLDLVVDALGAALVASLGAPTAGALDPYEVPGATPGEREP